MNIQKRLLKAFNLCLKKEHDALQEEVCDLRRKLQAEYSFTRALAKIRAEANDTQYRTENNCRSILNPIFPDLYE